MKIMWPQADFCSGNIYTTLSFQIKKIQIQIRVFVLLKCQQNLEIL